MSIVLERKACKNKIIKNLMSPGAARHSNLAEVDVPRVWFNDKNESSDLTVLVVPHLAT